jgi:hypothetical protein
MSAWVREARPHPRSASHGSTQGSGHRDAVPHGGWWRGRDRPRAAKRGIGNPGSPGWSSCGSVPPPAPVRCRERHGALESRADDSPRRARPLGSRPPGPGARRGDVVRADRRTGPGVLASPRAGAGTLTRIDTSLNRHIVKGSLSPIRPCAASPRGVACAAHEARTEAAFVDKSFDRYVVALVASQFRCGGECR